MGEEIEVELEKVGRDGIVFLLRDPTKFAIMQDSNLAGKLFYVNSQGRFVPVDGIKWDGEGFAYDN